MMQSNSSRCRSCKGGIAKWDRHDLCIDCRSCSEQSSCNVCRAWKEEWNKLAKFKSDRDKRLAKKKAKDKDKDKDEEGATSSNARQARAATVFTDVNGRLSSDQSRVTKSLASPASSSEHRCQSMNSNLPTHQPDPTPSTSQPSRSTESFQQGTSTLTAAQVNRQESSISLEVIDPEARQSQVGQVSNQPAEAIRDLLLVSDASSVSQRDFEGFSDQASHSRRSRSRSRSRRHKRRHHRLRHSSSSSGSVSSPSPKRNRDHSKSSTLDSILNLLSGLVQKSSSQLEPSSQASTSSQPSTSFHDQSAPFSPADSSDPGSDVDPVLEDREGIDILSVVNQPPSDEELSASGSDEEPLYGTDIPQDVFARAVSIVRNHLGYEEPASKDPPSKSKLSLNKPTQSSKAAMPVDAECEDRYRASAASATSYKWTAFSKAQNLSFRVEEKDWLTLFKTPAVPQAARDYLRSVGSVDSSGNFKSQADKRSLKSLKSLDAAARVGLKFSSSLLLIAEILSKSVRQPSQVAKKDIATLVSLLGPISRRVYDQFARVSTKAVIDQRDVIINALRLPERDVRRRFRQLPVSGEDIFGGQFDSQLQAEVKRKKNLMKADLGNLNSNRPRSSRFSRPGPSNQLRRRQNQPSTSTSRRPLHPTGSGSTQTRRALPQRSFARPAPRGNFRNSRSSRGRGFSKP